MKIYTTYGLVAYIVQQVEKLRGVTTNSPFILPGSGHASRKVLRPCAKKVLVPGHASGQILTPTTPTVLTPDTYNPGKYGGRFGVFDLGKYNIGFATTYLWASSTWQRVILRKDYADPEELIEVFKKLIIDYKLDGFVFGVNYDRNGQFSKSSASTEVIEAIIHDLNSSEGLNDVCYTFSTEHLSTKGACARVADHYKRGSLPPLRLKLLSDLYAAEIIADVFTSKTIEELLDLGGHIPKVDIEEVVAYEKEEFALRVPYPTAKDKRLHELALERRRTEHDAAFGDASESQYVL